jgi:hypothetical protein
MNFGNAIEYLKMGDRLARNGWNGKGMFLFLVPGTQNGPVACRPHISMSTVDGDTVPWTASQTDVLAEDWYAV